MKLFDIVSDYVTKEIIGENVEIENICIDSRKIEKNSLFFCLKGNLDGKEFVFDAIKNGAVAVVCDSPIYNLGVTQIIVDNTRKALSYLCANFYKNPQKELKFIGVVGTNGKTSTCHILKHILGLCGKKIATIGTIGLSYLDYFKECSLTTLDPMVLFKELRNLVDKGCEYVAMEVSAHGIYYEKVAPICFECLIFTNCTQDHLDFFESFENYADCKKSIFKNGKAKFMLVNSDDKIGRQLLKEKNVFSYGIYSPSDIFAVNVKETDKGINYVINLFDSIYEVKCSLLGLFNVYNTMSAVVCAKLLGISTRKIIESLKALKPISGRMEKIAEYKKAKIYLDYAHTPDGLENVLISLRKITKGNLYCLFGCGGNRDRAKRPIMGRIAGDIADFVIITSDNPRFEEPYEIMKQIEFGVRESSLDYISIVDRKKAIIYVLENLQNGDTLLIAGKGAETYQEVLGVRHEFSDKDIVLEYLKNG